MFSPWTRTLDPFEDLVRGLSRLVDDLNTPFPTRMGLVSDQFLNYDLRDTGEEILVRTDVPGFTADQLGLSATEDTLTVRAERSPSLPEGYRTLRAERHHGTFTQTVQMPCKIDTEGVEASLEAGVLTVKLRKHAAERPRTIAITAKEN
ncbi:MAG: Hsp20/alpha crystallin family protein [Myxococcales bacterium FL481]|nr:MAG: Hsp20/alpha crystallin family protein [Myxococcales bacterium FL481]